MKSFLITEEQIARVIGGAAADEVSRRFNRHFDFLTIASWTAETPLGEGGIALSAEEIKACGGRAAEFFGLERSFLEDQPATTITDWAAAIASAISQKLDRFTFKSAARDERRAARTHKAEEVFQDAAAAANILYGRRRLLSFVAPHSLLGFELTIVTPNLQRIESLDARGKTPEALTQTMAYGDVLVATPTLWRYMMREELAAPDNTMAVSFGEPMTQELAAEMRKAGFGVLRELYGSTETGLIAWRDAPGEPFVLFDHWRYDNDRLIRLTPDGGEREVEASDFLEWKSKRSFDLSGRRDGAVQIGAVNVIPGDVAARLCDHGLVADCAISVGRRGDGVDRLIAHIVLKKGVAPDERSAREIDVWCRTELRQQERPRIFHFEQALSSEKPSLTDR
ncbi:4-coumarate--CoA ligase [hydrothermal vent metagenome]|uniref:4-coumarate--CoA ligase n=1 Tax=hydrothermal vent metagenome TaxID=652676 RepID=A0A3B0SLZ3_9ZZZZ